LYVVGGTLTAQAAGSDLLFGEKKKGGREGERERERERELNLNYFRISHYKYNNKN